MRTMFCKISIIKQDVNFISQTVVRQSFNHHHCSWHALKIYMHGILSDFEQFLPGQYKFVHF